jgi:hypothetical protein
MLSQEAIKEFQALHKEVYGTELSFAEATEQANQLFNLYKIVVKDEFEST